MWDKRYNVAEYVYGTEPNDFLRDNIRQLPSGRILSLAEGEGRNAVFLARQGYTVTAVDASAVGIKKGQKLAAEYQVEVEFIHADLAEFELGQSCWDGIVSVFCPLAGVQRRALHQAVQAGLKPGGVYLLEAYRPQQIHRDTGGGKDPDTMQTQASLQSELTGLEFEHLLELERDIIEGIFHTGISDVVQAIARKV